MPRFSYRDPVTQILKGWGTATQNAPGDLVQIEPDQFNEIPGSVIWNGTTWVKVVPLPPTSSALAQALDVIVTSTALPTFDQIKAVFQIWRRQVQ